ncbi:hypothetical protein [Bordetella bronchiseptica]|uniref:hypothetical protein n=1 Tax=Bordetella bronchiseptica TaxID=518 RepID=UPI0012692044|nr:hypothetical protein [Bordetella bronchiseptica]
MRFAYCHFCDDIRHEVGDKLSLIGVYGTEMYVQRAPIAVGTSEVDTPPIVLPKLCISGSASTPASNPLKSLSFHVFADDKVLQEHSLDPAQLAQMAERLKGVGSEHDPIDRIMIGIQIALTPYVVSADHTLKLIFLADGEELVAGKLRIRIKSSPAAENA